MLLAVVVTFELFAWHPCVNSIFGGFSLLLSVLAGAHKSVISAGGNSELNSYSFFIECSKYNIFSFH